VRHASGPRLQGILGFDTAKGAVGPKSCAGAEQRWLLCWRLAMQYMTKREAVAESLRGEILRGALPPGQQLQQDEIARRLGLSPTPVREAFSLLVAEGLLVARPHRGVVVAQVYPGEAHDMYSVRSFVEVMAASRAAHHLSAAARAELGALLRKSSAALKRGDLYTFRRASARFHDLIAEASGSRVLTELTRTLTARVLTSVPLDRNRMRRLQTEHSQLLKLLKVGDPEQAAALMRRHLHETILPLVPGRPEKQRSQSPGEGTQSTRKARAARR